MNLSIQSPKANAFFNPAALHTTRSAQTSPSLDTPELGPPKNGFGLGLAGFGGMDVSQVDALDPSNKGTAMGSQAVDAGEEDADNKIQNALDRTSHYSNDCSAAEGVEAAVKGAGLGLMGAGFANAAPPIAAKAALIGAVANFAEWHYDCATANNTNDKKIADLEARLEALEKEKKKTKPKGDTCEDPTAEPIPTEEDTAQALDKVESRRLSCPDKPGHASQLSVVDLEQVFQTQVGSVINWGPDGQNPTNEDDTEEPTKETPCGPDSPGSDRTPSGSDQD